MIIYLILLAALILFGIRFSSFHEDYIKPEQSTCIKGVFAVIVFLVHASNYLELGDTLGDSIFSLFIYIIGQSMVSIYFFYSGYGIMESYKNKKDYDRHFFKNRILKTLVHFDLAIILYILLNLYLGRIYSLRIYLLSLIGYVSIGNSSWFIFVLLLLYLLTFFGFFISKRFHISKNDFGLIMLCMSAALWITMAVIHMPRTYYNTLLCYPAGILCSCHQEKIDSAMKDTRSYLLVLIFLVTVSFLCFLFRGNNFTYSIFTLSACCLIIMFTMKFQIQNPVLLWIGTHSFSLFILQRIPMILLRHSRITESILFTAISWIAVSIIAFCFNILIHKIDRMLFGK